jgi:hypothetical protein
MAITCATVVGLGWVLHYQQVSVSYHSMTLDSELTGITIASRRSDRSSFCGWACHANGL